MKLSSTHQFLVYGDDVNMLSGRVHNIKENVVASKENGLEINAYKTKYMVMS